MTNTPTPTEAAHRLMVKIDAYRAASAADAPAFREHVMGAINYALEQSAAPKPQGEYPPLPEPYHVAYDDIDKEDVKCFAEGQLRAYVDTDRAMRAQAAPQQEPVAQGDALDAARYRWLRGEQQRIASVIDKEYSPGYWEYRSGDELDSAIDAARKQGANHDHT